MRRAVINFLHEIFYNFLVFKNFLHLFPFVVCFYIRYRQVFRRFDFFKLSQNSDAHENWCLVFEMYALSGVSTKGTQGLVR